MTEDEVLRLFAYPSRRETRKEKLIADAARLYRLGLTQQRHQPAVQSVEGRLRKFYLYPTFRCPLRCPYCFAEGGERRTKELAAADLLRITKEAVEAGYRSVVVSGGEPLVYGDFPAFLEGLSRLDKGACRLVLRTSFALKISEERMRQLCAVFEEIAVSIDGDEETNDALRGEGTYRVTVGNVRRALDCGGNVSVSAVLTAEQGEGQPGNSLRSLCRGLGIKKVVINSPVPMGRAKDVRIPYYEWRSDLEQAKSIEMKYSCGLGHNLYMEPDGRVYPCYAWCGEEHLLGDLSKESLQDILDRKEILSIMNCGVDTNEKCRRCDVRYFCGGRCKIWVNNHSDINSGDFDCADIRENILEELRKYGILAPSGEENCVLPNL